MTRLSHVVVAFIATLGLVLALSANLSPSSVARAADESRKTADESAPIAVCAIKNVADDLMQSDRFKPERDELEQQLLGQLTPLRTELEALQQEFQTATPETEGIQEKQQRYFQLQQQYERIQSQLVQQMRSFVATQYKEAYGLVRNSARALADEQGFRYLLASLDAEGEIDDANGMEGVQRDILGRPVLMSPEGADITDDVRADLKLD